MNKIVIEPELLKSLYYGNGYDTYMIGSLFGCSGRTVLNRMEEYGYPRRLSYGLTDFRFNDRQRQVFEGCMVGDGNLRWTGNNCYFRNGDIHKDYLVWLQKQLGIEDISRLDYTGWAYHLCTSVIPSLRKEYKRWYPDGAGTRNSYHYKVIPKDIELSLINVLFWYIGDGCYHKHQKIARFVNYFDFSDWILLLKELCKVFDVENGISINKQCKDNDGKQRYILRLNKSVTNKFFDMVDELDFNIPECYQYKFGR